MSKINEIDIQNRGALGLVFSALKAVFTQEGHLLLVLFAISLGFAVIEYGIPWVFGLSAIGKGTISGIVVVVSYILNFFIPFGIVKKVVSDFRGEHMSLKELAEFTLNNTRRWMELSFWSIFYYLKYPILGLFGCGIAYIIFGFLKLRYGFDITIMLPYFNYGLIAIAIVFAIWGVTRFPYLFAATYVCVEQNLPPKQSVIASYELVHGHFWRTIWSFFVAGIVETVCISLPLNLLIGAIALYWFLHSGLDIQTVLTSFTTPDAAPVINTNIFTFSSVVSDFSTSILQINAVLFGFLLYKTYGVKTENPVESRSIWEMR